MQQVGIVAVFAIGGAVPDDTLAETDHRSSVAVGLAIRIDFQPQHADTVAAVGCYEALGIGAALAITLMLPFVRLADINRHLRGVRPCGLMMQAERHRGVAAVLCGEVDDMLSFVAESVLTYPIVIAFAYRLFEQRLFFLEFSQMERDDGVTTSCGGEGLGVVVARLADDIVPNDGLPFAQTSVLLHAYLAWLVDTEVQDDDGVATRTIRQRVAIGAGRGEVLAVEIVVFDMVDADLLGRTRVGQNQPVDTFDT